MKKLIFPLIASFVMSILFIVSCNKNVSVSSVKLDKDSITLGIGGTETLTATVLPEKATNKTVVFTSSNPVVATVLPNGLVTGITKGEATIVVTTADGGFTASCQVKVDDIAVSEVKLNKNTLILDIDETEELIATVLPENATNKAVYWTISNPAVATVVNGMVYPISKGKAIITVTTLEGNKTAKCDLEVIKRVPVTGVSLNNTTLDLGVGNTELLLATIIPSNASNKNVTWSSSNASAIAVSNEGLVSGIAAGTAVITVTTEEGGFTATCDVKCENFTLPVVITLEPIKISENYPYDYKVKLRGNITNIGEPPYIERGFIYTMSPDDPLDPHPMGPGTTKVIVSGNGIGTYEEEVTLYFNTTIRAYAKTSMGTSYGEMVTVSFYK
jgi:uncharacterized protein YjdB